MTQITILFALLVSLALGGATRGDINLVHQSLPGDNISLDKVGKVEPPQSQTGGGGEGGFPGF